MACLGTCRYDEQVPTKSKPVFVAVTLVFSLLMFIPRFDKKDFY